MLYAAAAAGTLVLAAHQVCVGVGVGVGVVGWVVGWVGGWVVRCMGILIC